MKELANGIGKLIAALVLISLVAMVLAWPVQILWNSCLVPATVIALPINFWQALGLNFLFSILFKDSSNSFKSKND